MFPRHSAPDPALRPGGPVDIPEKVCNDRCKEDMLVVCDIVLKHKYYRRIIRTAARKGRRGQFCLCAQPSLCPSTVLR